ncbi:hypothetical protein P5673_020669 [Acropora cervicornis]|uniref:Uncharacterized protein n=1 Tax=Acropora cervicornis TaxID=6130 RepID=A0AAD9Q9F1_ACRCE|nr:hypothetical protein P5673_020669 [Acropora cervicornis]
MTAAVLTRTPEIKAKDMEVFPLGIEKYIMNLAEFKCSYLKVTMVVLGRGESLCIDVIDVDSGDADNDDDDVKMGAKGEPSSPTHAVVLSDVPGTASTVDKATSKRILNYLNNIDETMGQLAGLIAKFCDARRPRDRKRSVHPPSDTEGDLNLHAQDELNDDEDLTPLTEQSSANKNVIDTTPLFDRLGDEAEANNLKSDEEWACDKKEEMFLITAT